MRYGTVVEHYRIEETSDGQGGFTESLVLQGEVPVRISRNSARTRLEGEKASGENDYTVYSRAVREIARGDVLETKDGRQFEILNVLEPSLASRHVEMDAEQIEKRDTV